jgi:hypothetical protein
MVERRLNQAMMIDDLLFSPRNRSTAFCYTSFCRLDTEQEVTLVIHRGHGVGQLTIHSARSPASHPDLKEHRIWFDDFLSLQCALIEKYP